MITLFFSREYVSYHFLKAQRSHKWHHQVLFSYQLEEVPAAQTFIHAFFILYPPCSGAGGTSWRNMCYFDRQYDSSLPEIEDDSTLIIVSVFIWSSNPGDR